MVMKGKIAVPEEYEKDILVALYRYYTNDLTFEKVAEDARVPVYFLVQYVNDNDLPIVLTEKDVTDGFQKVIALMKEKGIDISKFNV
ncbi:MAG: hypothetical protein HY051_02195 [Candidatus Aenigmarchaeota archaeon]|nr:hypothetical protein [Candidatus Aenigmarchaeota archaeon]